MAVLEVRGRGGKTVNGRTVQGVGGIEHARISVLEGDGEKQREESALYPGCPVQYHRSGQRGNVTTL